MLISTFVFLFFLFLIYALFESFGVAKIRR